MDINELKNIIEKDGGKFIIVENGKPIMVVMKFEDYKKTQDFSQNEKDQKNEELTIEDLPF